MTTQTTTTTKPTGGARPALTAHETAQAVCMTTKTQSNPAQAPDAQPVTAADYADMLTREGSARFVHSIRHQYYGRNPDMLSALKEFVIACAGEQRREGHRKWINKLGIEYTNSLA